MTDDNKEMALAREKSSYERWPMTTSRDADRYQQMFMEYGLGFEIGWKESRDKYYNQAIDDAIGVVNKKFKNKGNDELYFEITETLESLKK